MYKFSEAKQQALTEIKQAMDAGISPAMDELTVPPDSSIGDIAYPCFVLASKVGKSPDELAIEIAAKIGPKGFIKSTKAVGPYVNFVFNEKFALSVLDEIEELLQHYGENVSGKDKRVMVEYANLNTHKDVHVGHLRNLFLGQMTVDVLKANGFDVVPVAYINDLGAHVAKSVWAIMTYHGSEEVAPEKRIEFLRDVYVEATKKVDVAPSLKARVAEVFKELEAQKGESVAVWKRTRKWSLELLHSVYEELGLTIESWYFESELIKKTKKIIDEMIKKEIVVKSDGAWIVDLQEQGLGVNLLIKSDGTLLYNAKDLALAYKKESDYHPHRSIYVVDNRQSHALKQLFATLELMEFNKDLYHLAYDFVSLKDGAMATRKGNVIRYEELRDELFEESKKETQLRHKDWSVQKIEDVSKRIAFSAMRFGMLKQDPDKQIIFELKEALSFDGFSGPYLLYTNARVNSILKKIKREKLADSADLLSDPLSHKLLVAVSKYPEVVFEIAQSMKMNELAQYLFDLCRTFSAFYSEVPILKAPDSVRAKRIRLIMSFRQVLQNGLSLMGIETVDEM